MLFSVEQAMVGRDEKWTPLKTLAWEVNKDGRYREKGLFINKKDTEHLFYFLPETQKNLPLWERVLWEKKKYI